MNYVLAFMMLHPALLLCYALWARTGLRVFAALGFVPDVLLNYTTMAVLLGWPRRGEWTITKRLRRQRYELGRRGMWAHRLAEFLNDIKSGHV